MPPPVWGPHTLSCNVLKEYTSESVDKEYMQGNMGKGNTITTANYSALEGLIYVMNILCGVRQDMKEKFLQNLKIVKSLRYINHQALCCLTLFQGLKSPGLKFQLVKINQKSFNLQSLSFPPLKRIKECTCENRDHCLAHKSKKLLLTQVDNKKIMKEFIYKSLFPIDRQ